MSTTIWISGASSGIGAALRRTAPDADATIINLDRECAEGIRTKIFDLAKPKTWTDVDAHFRDALADPALRRAVFLHCAYAPVGKGVIAGVDPDSYAASLIANNAGILAIAASFFRHLRPDLDAGLMIMSSGAAATSLPGYSAYGSAKAGVEQWVRVARAEVRRRGWGPWVVAVRPGLVRTATALEASSLDPSIFPLAAGMTADLAERGQDADVVARRIWQSLRPGSATSAVLDLDAKERSSEAR